MPQHRRFSFLIALILAFSPVSSVSWAQVSPLKTENLRQTLEENVIKDRSISSRCQFLNQQRKDRILHKQKLSALRSRTDRLLKIVKTTDRESLGKDPGRVQEELRGLQRRVQQELRLTNQRINHREDHLVRTGCPTIRL